MGSGTAVPQQQLGRLGRGKERAVPLAARKIPAGEWGREAHRGPGPCVPSPHIPSSISASCMVFSLSPPLSVLWFPGQRQEQGETQFCLASSHLEAFALVALPAWKVLPKPRSSQRALLPLQGTAEMPPLLEASQPLGHCLIMLFCFPIALTTPNPLVHVCADSPAACPSTGTVSSQKTGSSSQSLPCSQCLAPCPAHSRCSRSIC